MVPLADYSFGEVLWTMFIFFIWMAWIFVLIQVFIDNFRRDDHGGWAKAGWTLFMIFLPFLGVLVYLIARPKMTEQDVRMLDEAQTQQRRMAGYSSADEIAKLAELHKQGAITDEEFAEMKHKAM